jgi:hypothetical protein
MAILFKYVQCNSELDIHTPFACTAERTAALTRALELDSPAL